jgi:hypothetical protein
MQEIKLSVGKDVAEFTCCICKEKCYGWGNNPEPIIQTVNIKTGKEILGANGESLECCDECNNTKVIPERIRTIPW